MFKWTVFAPARPAAYAFAFALIGALAVVGTSSNSVAEEKKAAPKAPKKDAPKAAPRQPEAAAGAAGGAATDLSRPGPSSA